MTTQDNDGPAFPCEWDYINTNRAAANGMTLRDYFAAKAMQGLIVQNKFSIGMGQPHWTKQAANSAYLMADAMLTVRKQQ